MWRTQHLPNRKIAQRRCVFFEELRFDVRTILCVFEWWLIIYRYYGKTIPAYRYCVKSKIETSDKISDNQSTVLQQKKCPNSMSEVNLLKWHDIIISSHFSSKIGHDKIKFETTLVLGYFYTACSGRSRPFCIFIRCESCKWRPPTVALWDLRETIRIQALLSLVNPWLCWFPKSRKWNDSRVPWKITTTVVNRCVSKRMKMFNQINGWTVSKINDCK